MKFMAIRPSPKSKQHKYMMVMEKDEKYGELIHQEVVRTSAKLVLIVGAHDCGKSRYLNEFYNFHEMYKAQMMLGMRGAGRNGYKIPKPLYIKQLDSQSDWFLQVSDWYEETRNEQFKKLSVAHKVDAVCDYLEQTRALLLVDDIEMMNGKKIQFVKRFVSSAYRTVATCRSENKIHPSLRGVVMQKCEQVVRLESQVSYDATPVILSILMIFIAFGISPLFGAMLLLGGLGKLATGMNATRNK